MFLRILGESFARNPRRKALMAAAIALGMTVATATLSVALDVGDRLAREFRSLGANLLVTPQADTLPLEIGGVDYRPVSEGAYLSEGDLGKLKTIFWRNNIVGFTPFLDVPVEVRAGSARPARATLLGTWFDHRVALPDGSFFSTGASVTHPWWSVEGQWFAEGARQCVVGAALARRAGVRVGDALAVRAGELELSLRVTGVLLPGSPEEDALLVPLDVAQELARRPGRLRRLLVSALTRPEDDLARHDPAKMTPQEYDRWYCTPYISSIAHQIGEVLPGMQARAIRRVAESEGRILTRVGGLMWLVTLAALASAALVVAAASATTVLERRMEVGLMKALGAADARIASFFLAEQVLLALVGGLLGYLLGLGLARVLGHGVFGAAPQPQPALFPVVLCLSALVALLGSAVPLVRAARMSAAPILRGE